jgi:hypothetical protein
MLWLR